MNVESFIKAKSDQLNADDLVGGPITVKIEGVSQGSADQPVIIKISGGHQPYKPCKTSLRVLAAVMGTDAQKWVGHWMRLYRDPHVKWAGVEVGGIRIEALSAIDEPVMLQLTETRGRKSPHRIAPLKVRGGEAAGPARGSAASQGARAPSASAPATDSTASPGPHTDSDGAGAPEASRGGVTGPSAGAVLTVDQLTLIREAIQSKTSNDTAYARWVGKLCAAYSVERVEDIPLEHYDEIASKLEIAL